MNNYKLLASNKVGEKAILLIAKYEYRYSLLIINQLTLDANKYLKLFQMCCSKIEVTKLFKRQKKYVQTRK